MVEVNPKVQAILDEYKFRGSGNMTVTQQNPEIFQAAERIVTTQQVSYSQGPEIRTYHTENVKRSGVPSQQISEGYVGTSGFMSREEWLARNPDKQPVLSISHEEWVARQGLNNNTEVRVSGYREENVKRSGNFGEVTYVNREIKPAMESISHEEWMRRQALNNNEVRVGEYREENVKRSGNFGEVTYVDREVRPMESISYEEWMRRQALNNNEVRISGYREENVKRSGNIGGEVTYVSGGVIPYDYKDFRPKDFNYEYREQRPVQYETVYERSPVHQVIYEEQRPPVNVTVQQQPPPVIEVREEKTKQKKPPIVFEGERKPSGWCC